jgi:hypothetical protein
MDARDSEALTWCLATALSSALEDAASVRQLAAAMTAEAHVVYSLKHCEFVLAPTVLTVAHDEGRNARGMAVRYAYARAYTTRTRKYTCISTVFDAL